MGSGAEQKDSGGDIHLNLGVATRGECLSAGVGATINEVSPPHTT